MFTKPDPDSGRAQNRLGTAALDKRVSARVLVPSFRIGETDCLHEKKLPDSKTEIVFLHIMRVGLAIQSAKMYVTVKLCESRCT